MRMGRVSWTHAHAGIVGSCLLDPCGWSGAGGRVGVVGCADGRVLVVGWSGVDGWVWVVGWSSVGGRVWMVGCWWSVGRVWMVGCSWSGVRGRVR